MATEVRSHFLGVGRIWIPSPGVKCTALSCTALVLRARSHLQARTKPPDRPMHASLAFTGAVSSKAKIVPKLLIYSTLFFPLKSPVSFLCTLHKS